MLVYVKKIISIHTMGCGGFHLGKLRVQSHRIAYNPEDGDIIDPISYMSTPRWRDPRPRAIFSQAKSLVWQRFYFSRHNSIFDPNLGSNVALEPEPFNQVRAKKVWIIRQ